MVVVGGAWWSNGGGLGDWEFEVVVEQGGLVGGPFDGSMCLSSLKSLFLCLIKNIN